MRFTLYYMSVPLINYKCKMKKRMFWLILFITGLLVTEISAAIKHPVPRFVSLRSNDVKMRVGPGREYPVKWVLKRTGLPMKIIAEYDTWRQVECHDGTSGWIHQSLLTGRRTLMVINQNCRLLSSADRDAFDIAKLLPRTLVTFKLQDCKSERCYINIQGTGGWVRKSQVWGLLNTE